MSTSDHGPAPFDRLREGRSDPPVAGRAADDPVAAFAFWGRDGAARPRSSAVSWLERIRGEARLGVAALLACALVAGLVWYRIGVGGADASKGASGAPRSAAGNPTSSSGAPTTRTAPGVGSSNGADAELVVHVAGAVVRPGIVRLRAGARVVDAIDAAGGARPEADLDQLNLAAKVADGQRIGVGLPGQAASAVGAAGSGTAGMIGGSGGSEGGLLNLNTATQTEIETLPGIGPVLGAAILRERDERGGFRTVDELRSVRGIGEMRFADLRDLVTV